MTAQQLNLHHLRYFHAVAVEGNLTRTAQRLRVSQSALSSQIRQLESELGTALFDRVGRRLELTEAGRIARDYAEEIFAAGVELVDTLAQGRRRQQTLRVGAVATLSRNFQRSFVRPLLTQPSVRLKLSAGSLEELLPQLAGHTLDVVLANHPATRTSEQRFRSRLLARQPVSIVASRPLKPFRFPDDLAGQPMVLPSEASELRSGFDALCERHGVRVKIRAEVDDMATMRLVARDTDALALLPTVVVRDELRQGLVHELCVVPELSEGFYAITIDRRYQHPLLRALLDRDEQQLLAMGPEREPLPPTSSAEAHGTTTGRRGRPRSTKSR